LVRSLYPTNRTFVRMVGERYPTIRTFKFFFHVFNLPSVLSDFHLFLLQNTQNK
jgi:hypothetical protein